MKFFLLLGLTFLIGCGATLQKQYEENLDSLEGHSGGSFSYLNEGVSSIREERFNDGIRQAIQICGGLNPKVIGTDESLSSGVMSMPVQNTAYHSGNVGGSNYSGTSTYTTYQSIPYSSSTAYITFTCPDKDVTKKSYFLHSSPDTSEPNCYEYLSHFAPGDRRIANLVAAPGTTNCLKKEGWIRFSDKIAKQSKILFIGEKGIKTCGVLRKRMIDELITADKSNLYLLKNLKCE